MFKDICIFLKVWFDFFKPWLMIASGVILAIIYMIPGLNFLILPAVTVFFILTFLTIN